MRPRTAWRLCVLAGLAAFACSWGFGTIPGLVACGSYPGGGPYSAVLSFEFARTPADIAALFGSGDCRTTLLGAQSTAQWLDSLGFIPTYTAFLVLGAIAVARGWARQAIVAGLLVGGLADEIEGVIMWRIMAYLPGTQGQLDALWWAVHVKFALLALGTAAIGLALVQTWRLWPMLFGLVVTVGGGAAVYGFANLPNAVMMAGFTYAWFALLATAIVASFASGIFAPRGASRTR